MYVKIIYCDGTTESFFVDKYQVAVEHAHKEALEKNTVVKEIIRQKENHQLGGNLNW